MTAPPKRANASLLCYTVFSVLAAVKAATDSRGALTPSNVHRTFSVRLNRFTGTMHADLRCNMEEECRRHFQRHRGFFPEGSLFVSLRATGSLLTIFLFCLPLSVRQKKCRNEETTARREVYRTPYWGKEKKSFGCKKYWKKRICYVLHISKNYCTFATIFEKKCTWVVRFWRFNRITYRKPL